MRIGIVAGESSGDMLAAGLISAIQEKYPDVVIEGIAGPLMIEQGCRPIYPAEKLSLLGLVEVLGHYRELRKIRDELFNHFLENKPDIFIGVDAPEFNLGLHEKLHKAGIKTVQYVSPQVWAWRQKRIRKIERDVDMVMTLFPFETDFYREHNVPVEFVGHPLADMIPEDIDVQQARNSLGLSADEKIVALLPGSRASEVTRLINPFLQTAQWCNKNYRADLHFVIPVANKTVEPIITDAIENVDLKVTVFQGQSRQLMTAADVILMASGTATLEALLLKKPMVVAYRLAWMTYHLLKRWVKIPYFSLPNLLAGEQVVPEIVQKDVRPEILGPLVLDYLDNTSKKSRLVDTFKGIHRSLRQGTNHRAATAVLQLIDQ